MTKEENETESNILKDCYGVPIKVGSTVVAPTTGGTIQRGKVVEIREGKYIDVKFHGGYEGDNVIVDATTIRTPTRIIVVTEKTEIPVDLEILLQKEKDRLIIENNVSIFQPGDIVSPATEEDAETLHKAFFKKDYRQVRKTTEMVVDVVVYNCETKTRKKESGLIVSMSNDTSNIVWDFKRFVKVRSGDKQSVIVPVAQSQFED